MKWTTKIPTKNGWYWALPREVGCMDGPEIVEVDIERSLDGRSQVYRVGTAMEAGYTLEDFALWSDKPIQRAALSFEDQCRWNELRLAYYQKLKEWMVTHGLDDNPVLEREIRILKSKL